MVCFYCWWDVAGLLFSDCVVLWVMCWLFSGFEGCGLVVGYVGSWQVVGFWFCDCWFGVAAIVLLGFVVWICVF